VCTSVEFILYFWGQSAVRFHLVFFFQSVFSIWIFELDWDRLCIKSRFKFVFVFGLDVGLYIGEGGVRLRFK
jgi:hypothetical protein